MNKLLAFSIISNQMSGGSSNPSSGLVSTLSKESNIVSSSSVSASGNNAGPKQSQQTMTATPTPVPTAMVAFEQRRLVKRERGAPGPPSGNSQSTGASLEKSNRASFMTPASQQQQQQQQQQLQDADNTNPMIHHTVQKPTQIRPSRRAVEAHETGDDGDGDGTDDDGTQQPKDDDGKNGGEVEEEELDHKGIEQSRRSQMGDHMQFWSILSQTNSLMQVESDLLMTFVNQDPNLAPFLVQKLMDLTRDFQIFQEKARRKREEKMIAQQQLNRAAVSSVADSQQQQQQQPIRRQAQGGGGQQAQAQQQQQQHEPEQSYAPRRPSARPSGQDRDS
jgi:hypothetical protein